MPLFFEDLEKAKENIMASQKKEIASLYSDWADEIHKEAVKHKYGSTASDAIREKQLRDLKKMLEESGKYVSNEVAGIVKKNMYLVADETVKANASWLSQFGFSEDGVNAAFSYVPNDIVQMLITGQIYDSGWSLSKRIWSDNEETMKSAYWIVAKGAAENKSVFEISKDLEKFVRPEVKKPWNPVIAMKNTQTGKIEYKRIYKSSIDYNAQRLARTLTQHAYQQSFIAVTKNNPFVIDYIWHSNGSRPCPLCQDRDGVHYKKDELPMDHPNGMCIMEPNVDEDAMAQQLIDWFNSPDGTYPEIDEFAGNFGYESAKPTFSTAQEKYLAPYGFSPENMPKNFDDWSHKISYEQGSEILKSMGTSWSDPHPYQKLMQYYNENLATLKVQQPGAATGIDAFIAKYGKSTKSPNAWFNSLSPIQKAEAKLLKEQSGLTWNEWYKKNIYSGDGSNLVTKAKNAVNNIKNTVANSGIPSYTTWIESLKRNREEKMLEKEVESMLKIGDAGKRGIKTYSGSSYEEMNAYLRFLSSGKTESEAISLSGIRGSQLDAVKDAIDGLSKSNFFDEAFVLRRGTDLGDIAGLFMQGDFYDNKMSLYGKSASELNDMFSGAVGQYGSFTSTSSIWSKGFDGNVEVILYAPAGTNGSSIMSISRFGTSEGETLLNTATNVRCVKIEESDGHMGSSIRMFLEIIP